MSAGRRRGILLASSVMIVLAAAASPARADDAACIAASEQSIALRKEGKLHDTLKQLAACAVEACPAEVKAECTRRIGEIDAAMPTLILAAKDGAGNDLYDVKVSMDGAPLLASLDGRPASIDPGAHTFVFEQAGQPPVEKKLVLREGDKDRREGVVIGEVPAPPPIAVGPAPSSSWSTGRKLAAVAGGLGVVGVGVGALFGAFALSSQNQEKSNCSPSSCSNRNQANADYDTATKDATGSTIAFIAGGAFLAAGAVLWFTSPRTESNPAAPAPAPARVGVAPALRGSGISLVGEF